MSEVPSGLNFSSVAPVPIRDSASLMLTRNNNNEIEILLGKRANTMRAFPNFWSFPGGGLSRKDLQATTKLNLEYSEHTAMKICIVRELCEELGLTINKNEVVSVDPKIRTSIIDC